MAEDDTSPLLSGPFVHPTDKALVCRGKSSVPEPALSLPGVHSGERLGEARALHKQGVSHKGQEHVALSSRDSGPGSVSIPSEAC